MDLKITISGLPLVVGMILIFFTFLIVWFTFLEVKKIKIITKSIVLIIGILPISKVIDSFRKK